MNRSSLQILSDMRMEMIGGWCISLSGSVESLVQTLEDLQDSGKPRCLEVFTVRSISLPKDRSVVSSTTLLLVDHSCPSKQLLPSQNHMPSAI